MEAALTTLKQEKGVAAALAEGQVLEDAAQLGSKAHPIDADGTVIIGVGVQ